MGRAGSLEHLYFRYIPSILTGQVTDLKILLDACNKVRLSWSHQHCRMTLAEQTELQEHQRNMFSIRPRKRRAKFIWRGTLIHERAAFAGAQSLNPTLGVFMDCPLRARTQDTGFCRSFDPRGRQSTYLTKHRMTEGVGGIHWRCFVPLGSLPDSWGTWLVSPSAHWISWHSLGAKSSWQHFAQCPSSFCDSPKRSDSLEAETF